MFYRSWPRLGVTTSWSGWSATGTGATSNLWTIEGVAVSWQLGGGNWVDAPTSSAACRLERNLRSGGIVRHVGPGYVLVAVA